MTFKMFSGKFLKLMKAAGVYLLTIWVFLGGAGAITGGYGIYLPSPQWIAESRNYATFAGVVMACLGTWLILRDTTLGGFKKFCVVTFGFFLSATVGTSAVFSGGPMLIAMWQGTQTRITYTMADVRGISDRRCKNPIQLEGLPFVLDKLCGSSEEFRDTLYAGTRIAVTGKGTEMGIFPASASKGD